jgi:DNA-binding CsgD family transcriptional regulator/PAS domain-containing protein
MPEAQSEIIAALYRAAAGELPWSDALRCVGDAVGGAFTLIGFVDKVANRTNSITSEQFDPERRSRYRDRYFTLNPRVAHSARSPVGQVFYDASIAPDAELARHPYYAEYLAQRDFTHFISANLKNDAARRINLSVQRSRRAGHVDAADVRSFKALVPHAVAAFDLWEKVQNVSVQTQLLAEAFQTLKAAVLVLDQAGGLIFANDEGAALVGPSGLFVSRDGFLTVADPAERDRFSDVIAAARPRDDLANAAPGRIFLSSADGTRFSVTARPLPRLIRLDGGSLQGVLVLAERTRALSTVGELRRLLGLSAGEASLALALADGVGPADYARANGLAAEEIGERLASLHAKLEEGGRAREVAATSRQGDTVPFAPRPANGMPEDAPWAEQFGLTPAEMRLAKHLLAGQTVATYAASRGLSPHTVRNQLRSIYAKTDTNRQVSLLQLLLRASGKNP